MTLLAAFQVLLYRCSGQPDVVVGSAISGRKYRELESVVGLFVNSLPLRIDLSGNPSFRSVLLRVRETVLEAHQNQDIPFEELVKELRPPRDPGRNPLFQVFFSFRSRVGEDETSGVSSEVISGETAKFDLSLSMEEFSHGMKAEIEYYAEARPNLNEYIKRNLRIVIFITAAHHRIKCRPRNFTRGHKRGRDSRNLRFVQPIDHGLFDLRAVLSTFENFELIESSVTQIVRGCTAVQTTRSYSLSH